MPTRNGSVTATIWMTPWSESRCTRCRTAASDRPTALPMAEYGRRPSSCNCSMIRFDVSSRVTQRYSLPLTQYTTEYVSLGHVHARISDQLGHRAIPRGGRADPVLADRPGAPGGPARAGRRAALRPGGDRRRLLRAVDRAAGQGAGPG